jgi:site-specific recombinase XerC
MGAAWDDAVEAFAEHLRHERNLSEHSVRGYRTDLSQLAEHAQALGVEGPADLTTRALRSWLANQQTLGRARATIASSEAGSEASASIRGVSAGRPISSRTCASLDALRPAIAQGRSG